MPKNRGPREAVYVTLTPFKYGWLMNKTKFAAIGGDFGITAATSRVGVTFGANSPKPPTATIVDAAGNTSSFYDPSKGKALGDKGYILKTAKRKAGIRLSGKAVTVYVETPLGYKYAWNMASGDVDEAAEAGVKKASAGETNLVWGSFPKPPRAYKRTEAGGFSTFCPPTPEGVEAAVTAGFTVEGIDPDWGAAAATP